MPGTFYRGGTSFRPDRATALHLAAGGSAWWTLKQAEVRQRFPDPKLNFMLGDVRDLARLKLPFYGVDTVIHAAALKRVDATANDPLELVKTNVLGTSHVLQASLAEGVKKTLLISSDKACLPANAYGASKFMGEQVAVNFNVYAAPRGVYSSVAGMATSSIPVALSCIPGRLSMTHQTRSPSAAGREQGGFPTTRP